MVINPQCIKLGISWANTQTPRRPISTPQYKPHPTETMKAALWMGPRQIEVAEVAKPSITEPADAIVRITHTTICGSDLYISEGDLDRSMEKGRIVGHEAIGLWKRLEAP
ncbi:hypothetical protein EIK77_000700 [Talaromyces pinophilus]|nr:hypothetical protein EIK77_000700 [Talaromyces pinophilus]